jgi:hypothetical protein
MIIPTPLTAVAGTKVSASAFNAGVHDVFDFVMSTYPRVHAYVTPAQSIPNTGATGASNLIGWTAEIFDTDTMHDNGVNPGRITFQTAGMYEIDIQLSMAAAVYSTLTLDVRLNAGGVFAAGTNLRTQPFTDGARSPTQAQFRMTLQFIAGDYIECWVTQVSGAAANLNPTSNGSRIFAKWIAS